MAQTFFRTPFGSSGDVVTIPNDVQPSGVVSFTQGFGPDYEADPSNPAVQYPERRVVNEFFLLTSANIQGWQVHCFPDYIPAAQNNGSNYSYDKNAYVRWTDGNVYYSLVNANTADPSDPTKWGLLNPNPSSFLTGDMIFWEDTTIRTGGWVWANGATVGNATSNATGRANADTAALFAQIWRVFANAVRPIVNSDGSLGTRGANAAADYAANKALPVRDMRENTPVGTGTMGGASDPGRITNAVSGFDPTIFGNSGGTESKVLSLANLQHNHELPINPQVNGGTASYEILGSSWPPGNTGRTRTYLRVDGTNDGSVGEFTLWSGAAENGPSTPVAITQPETMCNFIIKL